MKMRKWVCCRSDERLLEILLPVCFFGWWWEGVVSGGVDIGMEIRKVGWRGFLESSFFCCDLWERILELCSCVWMDLVLRVGSFCFWRGCMCMFWMVRGMWGWRATLIWTVHAHNLDAVDWMHFGWDVRILWERPFGSGWVFEALVFLSLSFFLPRRRDLCVRACELFALYFLVCTLANCKMLFGGIRILWALGLWYI